MQRLRSLWSGAAILTAVLIPGSANSADPTARYSTARVAPYLTVKDAAGAIEFYKKAFGAVEISRVLSADGKILQHAELSLNNGSAMLSDEIAAEIASGVAPAPGQTTAVSISLQLDTAAGLDTLFAQSIKAGAVSIVDPTNKFWGARFAMVRDPYGHRWMLNSPGPNQPDQDKR